MYWCSRGHQLFTSLKLNMSKCFRISGVAVSVWCCYCNLEMALLPHSTATAAAALAREPEWADRSVSQWLPEFVFYNLDCLSACFRFFLNFTLFSFFFFLGVHMWQPQS